MDGKTISAKGLDSRAINDAIREAGNCLLTDCLGQRFLGAGMATEDITIEGIPGNALGAYCNGARITVHGSAQDAVGDTMNDGEIVVHGSIGDAAGYAMRGGKIFVRGNAGYRAGIHMKEYKEKVPLIVIGGCAGSFLGEYQAGGVIVVLGLGRDAADTPVVGDFPCTGMHGGRMFLRGDCGGIVFPPQVTARAATAEDMASIREPLEEFAALFGGDADELLASDFTVVTPDSRNPYQRMYVGN
ncbi:MAG: glutamate synthase [Clostridia bacterium]|nr:glutamate synthase [Clostridia bacterium]MBR4185680.1 glutamate synthase [Clostridia bacterium]